MPPVNTIVVHTILLPPGTPDATVRGQAERLLTRLGAGNEALQGREYLAGDFSAADTMLGHASVMSQRLGCVPAEMEHLTAYIERLLARFPPAKALAVE